MALFSLEALDARSGDALLLHHGDPPRLTVIDAGFSSTYTDVLRPRLEQLRDQRSPANTPITIEQVIVSHIDNDHITGVVKMFEDLDTIKLNQDPPLADVKRLWHNSFNDALQAIGGDEAEATEDLATAPAVAAGVPEGRKLRVLAQSFPTMEVNQGQAGLLMPPLETSIEGLKITLAGPTPERLEALRDLWEKDVKKRLAAGETAQVADYVDKSAPNLSSIVVHVEHEGKTMLLTGDGRGDDTLIGLETAGLLDDEGKLHVDLLKLPHHGSDRNVELDYFQRITADHYVISANGHDDNPSVPTLEMLQEARGDDEYTVYLTNPEIAEDFFNANPGSYTFCVRDPAKPSIVVDLLDPLGQ
jgi:beta-lactamase superfamily II metal-dependent hydrolase